MDGVSASVISVPEFYRGRSVFITGATGFCGKVLVEKLLRSCPEIGKIYVTVRSKRGCPPSERLHAVFALPLFDRLKREQPNALDKVVAIYGDILELGLGISEEDRETLQENVSIVFHVAAIVRFDDSLRNAVLMNIRGTREVLELATGMKNLKAFLHVSTSYCNTDRVEIGEEIYPAPADWRKLIKAVETIDDTTLQIITPKILSMRPNTYTFTKAVTEHLVNEYADRLPIIIHRPSIVISTHMEPMPGWIDNFNGPVGLVVAIGKGFMRVTLADPEIDADFMPVDIAIKSMILATWEKGVRPVPNECAIYNCSSKVITCMKGSEMMKLGMKFSEEYPMRDILWVPGHQQTKSEALYYIMVLLFHLLPAFCYDAVMRLTGGKTMLIKLQRRIFIANLALKYFLIHEWTFFNNRFMSLDKLVLPEDREDWAFDFTKVDTKQFLLDTLRGGQIHLLKEDPAWLPEARRNLTRMYWLDKAVRSVAYLAFARFIWTSGLIQHIFLNVYNLFVVITS